MRIKRFRRTAKHQTPCSRTGHYSLLAIQSEGRSRHSLLFVDLRRSPDATPGSANNGLMAEKRPVNSVIRSTYMVAGCMVYLGDIWDKIVSMVASVCNC